MERQTIENLYEIFLKSNGVVIDSRKVSGGDMFFALKGEHVDGNKYANDAIKKGASVAVIDDCRYESEKTVCVENVLETLQMLARHHLSVLGTRVFALTGTNGKTTTKELIKQVLSAKFNVFATEGNFNNHIGLPLMVLKMRERYDIAVLEMGASKPGDIKELCDIANPEFGLITNIGKAHLEFFGSRENLIKTKSELYDAVNSRGGVIFFNCANRDIIDVTKYKNAKIVTYGLNNKDCDFTAEPLLFGLFAGIRISGTEISSNLAGSYNSENIIAAYSVGSYFGVPEDEIKRKIEEYIPVNKRSQFIKSDLNEIILDAYNANPTSMQNALNSFLGYDTKLPRVLILGDMLELGKESDIEHKSLLERLKNENIRLFAVGKNFGKFKYEYKQFMFFDTTDDLKKYLKNNKISGSFVLIKGSRGIALEKILDLL